MKLRTRLILALLLLSVLPLAAITITSYRTSVTAFRGAVEREAGLSAGEMSGRVERVRASLSKRFDQLGATPLEAAEGRGPGSDATGPGHQEWQRQIAEVKVRLARELGRDAAFLKSVEIVPRPPAAPRRVPAAPAAPAPPVVRVDVGQILEMARSAAEAQSAQQEAQLTRALAQLREHERAARDEAEERQIAEERSHIEDALEAIRDRREEFRDAVGEAGAQLPATLPKPPAPPATAAEVTVTAPVAPPAGPKPAASQLECPLQRGDEVVGRVRAQLDLDRLVASALEASRPDTGEVPFAVDPTGRVVAPQPKHARIVAGLLAGRPRTEGTFLAHDGDEDWVVVTRRDPGSDTLFGIARPVGARFAEIRRAAGRNLGLGLLAVALASIVIVPLANRMTRHLHALTDGARRIASGDLDTRVPVRSRDEIGELASAFNGMAADLAQKQHDLLEQERIKQELALCRQIQDQMLPKAPLRLGLAEIDGVSIPAREVGGDFFNYFAVNAHGGEAPDGEVALLVGDVSGKGVGAALLMANVQATLRARLAIDRDLSRLADVLDREIEAATPPEVYLTLFVGLLDLRARRLRYVSAGHNTQYLVRASGGIEPLGSCGLPLGLFSGHGYEEREVALEHGDLLFFYTDGVTEVVAPDGDMFGRERLEALLRTAPRAGVDRLLAAVEDEVRRFRDGTEPPDDATMMALRLA